MFSWPLHNPYSLGDSCIFCLLWILKAKFTSVTALNQVRIKTPIVLNGSKISSGSVLQLFDFILQRFMWIILTGLRGFTAHHFYLNKPQSPIGISSQTLRTESRLCIIHCKPYVSLLSLQTSPSIVRGFGKLSKPWAESSFLACDQTSNLRNRFAFACKGFTQLLLPCSCVQGNSLLFCAWLLCCFWSEEKPFPQWAENYLLHN